MRSRRASPEAVAAVNPPLAEDGFAEFDAFLDLGPRRLALLRSLVLEGAAARQALATWLAEVDLDAIGNAESRLIPAVVARHGATLARHPLFARMEGTYRYWQLRNSLMLADGRRALERLRDAHVEPVLFKGVAMVLRYYRNPAERPMGDLDALVPFDQVQRAQGALLRSGWRLARSGPDRGSDVHARDFLNANRCGFDLHWHALYESPVRGLDEGLRRRAQGLDWAGLAVRVMAPEDLLLTGLVNGIRVGGPPPLQWIVDAARIAAGPVDWEIVWSEAKRRGVRREVFEALNMVHRVSPSAMPEATLRGFLGTQPGLHRELLARARAEGRTYGLRPSRVRAPAAEGAPRHVRIFQRPDRGIARLFIQRRDLARLGDLFDVRDRAWSAKLASAAPAPVGSFVDVPAGALASRPHDAHWDYEAAITVRGPRTLRLAPGEARRVPVVVENRSSRCWAVADDHRALLGVSYHLHGHGGELLALDLPRTYLLHARAGHVAFIEPGQKVASEVTVIAPEDPGRYRARLDLVQEHVAWFSHRGCTFPELALEVREEPPAPCHRAGGPGIVHVPRDGETVIVDTLGARYFTVSGHGPWLWEAMLQRTPTRRIVAAFAAAGIRDAAERIVRPFIAALLREGLAVPCKPGRGPRVPLARVVPLPGAQRATLAAHPEPTVLMALHPLGGSSVQAGWPARREATPQAS